MQKQNEAVKSAQSAVNILKRNSVLVKQYEAG